MAALLCLFVVALCSAGDTARGPVHAGQTLYRLSCIPALNFDTGFHRPDFEKLLFSFFWGGGESWLVSEAVPCILASRCPNVTVSSLSVSRGFQ